HAAHPHHSITLVLYSTHIRSPGADVKSLSLGTRWLDAASKPGELKTAVIEPGKLTKSYPLGPTDVLDVSWEAPKTALPPSEPTIDRKSTRLNYSHVSISYAVF